MKAVVYQGPRNVKVESVPDPKILAPTDAIVRVTSTAICGSDLHLINGFVPSVMKGDILGHEFIGVVEQTGSAVTTVRAGDRVIVPFTIACGGCNFCKQGLAPLCDNSNPNVEMADVITGHGPGGLYGYSHVFGGYPGGQAEYARVVFADANLFKIPGDLEDEQVLFLTDIFPTGYQAVEQCDLKPGDVVAIWGCGPVGQFAIQSAFLLGAKRVIAIDRIEERLERAREFGAITINFDETDVLHALNRYTGGRGPDAVVDAVGLEAHAFTPDAILDRAKQVAKVNFDRTHVVRQAIFACGKGGTVSIPGAYVGATDLFPLGQLFAKSLKIKCGQTNVHRYIPKLMDLIAGGQIDPRRVITHRLSLDDAVDGYDMFMHKTDNCQKVVLHPTAA